MESRIRMQELDAAWGKNKVLCPNAVQGALGKGPRARPKHPYIYIGPTVRGASHHRARIGENKCTGYDTQI